MLSKLMKYEFRASGRILLPIYAATLVMGFLSGIFMKIFTDNMTSGTALSGSIEVASRFPNFGQLLTLICTILYVLLIFAAIILSYIIAITRFKKNLFDSEGYLMNTLPVTSTQNILAKLFVATIYQILGMIVACLSGLVLALICISADKLQLGELFAAFGKLVSEIGVGPFILYSIESIILGFLCFFCGNLAFYASISIGHSANSHKILKSVGAYIALYIVAQIISFNIIAIAEKVLNARVYDMTSIFAPQPYFIGTIILEGLYACAYFAITRYFLKNKLNLQ